MRILNTKSAIISLFSGQFQNFLFCMSLWHQTQLLTPFPVPWDEIFSGAFPMGCSFLATLTSHGAEIGLKNWVHYQRFLRQNITESGIIEAEKRAIGIWHQCELQENLNAYSIKRGYSENEKNWTFLVRSNSHQIERAASSPSRWNIQVI